MKLRYTHPASVDLDSILTFLNSQSPSGVRRLAARIRAVERMLVQFPLAGEPTRPPWLRRIRIGPYPDLISYEAAAGEVIVHAVRHGARAPSSMPDQG